VLGVTTRVPGKGVKLAAILLGPDMTKEAGFAVPEKSPDHPLKRKPAFSVAETETLCPRLNQFVPGRLTVPPSGGFTEIVKPYSVAKLAV